MKEKSIVLKTWEVQAILNGSKTVLRRHIKRTPCNDDPSGYGFWKDRNESDNRWYIKDYTHSCLWWTQEEYIKRFSKYQVGDIVWIKETWCDRWLPDGFLSGYDRYGYKADGIPSYGYWGNDNQCKDNVWISSIYMPKEASRLSLKITNIKIERLHNISTKDILKEGIYFDVFDNYFGEARTQLMFEYFEEIWNSSIKKKDIDMYGWDSNPYVWIIEFEKVEVR